MLGYREDDLIGKFLDDFVTQNDRHNDADLVREMITGKRSSYEIEKKFERRESADSVRVHAGVGDQRQ